MEGRREGITPGWFAMGDISQMQVAPEVGAKGLSVLARSPVGWDEASIFKAATESFWTHKFHQKFWNSVGALVQWSDDLKFVSCGRFIRWKTHASGRSPKASRCMATSSLMPQILSVSTSGSAFLTSFKCLNKNIGERLCDVGFKMVWKFLELFWLFDWTPWAKTMEPELSIFGRRKEEMQIAEARKGFWMIFVWTKFAKILRLDWDFVSDWYKLTGIEVNQCNKNTSLRETFNYSNCMSCAWIPCMLLCNIVDCKYVFISQSWGQWGVMKIGLAAGAGLAFPGLPFTRGAPWWQPRAEAPPEFNRATCQVVALEDQAPSRTVSFFYRGTQICSETHQRFIFCWCPFKVTGSEAEAQVSNIRG